MGNDKITVGLILGGISGERPVSLETGRAVYEALKKRNFGVKIIDPALGKKQYAEDEDYWNKEPQAGSKRNFLETFSAELFDEIDAVFVALHGPYGEDGTTQRLLELLNVPYVGSDSFSSSIGMNKFLTKIVAENSGVKFPHGFLVRKNSFDLISLRQKIEKEIPGKFVVKPNGQGSSLGLTICESVRELENALTKGFEIDDELIIEEFVEGRELTAPILLDRNLPVLEIVPESGLYDFEAKYESDTTKYLVPAPIDEELAEKIKNAGRKVFSAIGCRDYARVDFRLNSENEFFCLEINTLPGMTSHSLLPKAALHTGLEFDELVEQLIRAALER